MAEIIKFKKSKKEFKDFINDLRILCKDDLEAIDNVILEKLDSKVPLVMKENYPLVCSVDNEIIWIPGIRVTKTSKNSSNYIKISFEGNFLYDW